MILWCLSWFFLCVLIRRIFTCKIIGITGGIASGKSSFVNHLGEVAPVPVIDFDIISRDVSAPGAAGWMALRKQFPAMYFNPVTGELRREELGYLIFADAAQRRILNQSLQLPMMILFLWELFGAFFVRKQRVVFVIAPLLFESKLHWICNSTVCVVCSEENQIRRLSERDNISAEQVQLRIGSQMSMQRKGSMSDLVVLNDAGLKELHAEAEKLLFTVGDMFEVEEEGLEDDGKSVTRIDWCGKVDSWAHCLKPNICSIVASLTVVASGGALWGSLSIWRYAVEQLIRSFYSP